MAQSIGPYSTATEMLGALRARKISSLELVELHLQRIERARRRAERDSGAHRGSRARCGAGCGRGARARPARRAARFADDAEGVDADRGSAAERRHAAVQGPQAGGGRNARESRVRSGRVSARQDQHSGRARRLAGRQPDLRTHEQSVGSEAHAGRQYRWWRRGAGRRHDAARNRQRHRRIDSGAGRLLRRVRTPAVRNRDSARRLVSDGAICRTPPG